MTEWPVWKLATSFSAAITNKRTGWSIRDMCFSHPPPHPPERITRTFLFLKPLKRLAWVDRKEAVILKGWRKRSQIFECGSLKTLVGAGMRGLQVPERCIASGVGAAGIPGCIREGGSAHPGTKVWALLWLEPPTYINSSSDDKGW